MHDLLKQLRRNSRQLTIVVVCLTGILSILLLLGSSVAQKHFVIKIFLFAYIFCAFVYFVISYRRQLLPEVKNYLRAVIRKRNPDILFPGDEGYAEALEAQRRKKEERGLKLIKSTHPNESAHEQNL